MRDVKLEHNGRNEPGLLISFCRRDAKPDVPVTAKGKFG